jgi:hypothetical protein
MPTGIKEEGKDGNRNWGIGVRIAAAGTVKQKKQ